MLQKNCSAYLKIFKHALYIQAPGGLMVVPVLSHLKVGIIRNTNVIGWKWGGIVTSFMTFSGQEGLAD